MLRRLFCAGVALLLVVGVTLAEDKKNEGKRQGPRNVAFGKVVSLKMEANGSGTLVVVSTPRDGGEAKKHKFRVTDQTKFVVGGGRGKEGTPVEANKVAETFTPDTLVAVRYEGESGNRSAKTVAAITPRKKPESK